MEQKASQQDGEVAIVIPAYNEGATIAKVVEQVSPYGVIIVVDDASKDDTKHRAEKAGATVVSHFSNRGYDGALNTGFSKAKKIGARYIITFDADGQHDPDDLPVIIEKLKAGADLVVGNRPKCARLSEKVFSLVVWYLHGVHDPLCGLKGYRTSLYSDAGCFDTCQSIGTQLLLYACKRKECYRIEQRSINIRARNDVARFGGIIKSNLRIIKALHRVMYNSDN